MPIRLAIVNDYELVVRGVAEMLVGFDDLRIVELNPGEAPSEHVDIALYDTFGQSQGGGPGTERLMRNKHVGKVAVYTWSSDPKVIKGALDQGARGYLSKTLSAEQLVEGLRSIHGGEQVISAAFGQHEHGIGNWPGKAEGLTEREAEIVALVAQGLTNEEITRRAHLSINSVKTYIRQAYRKMGVSSRTQAVLWALEHGFATARTARDEMS